MWIVKSMCESRHRGIWTCSPALGYSLCVWPSCSCQFSPAGMSAVVVTDIRDMQLFLDGSHLLSPPPSPSIYSHFLFHVDFLSPGYLTFVQTLITLTTNYKTARICLLFFTSSLWDADGIFARFQGFILAIPVSLDFTPLHVSSLC